MRIVFLGTGTSVGVPMIGCSCPVCTSPDPRNRRTRASLYLTSGSSHLVVDTPPDFREQALARRYPRIDALLYTHAHADHVFGLDDVRRFNAMQNAAIPVWAGAETREVLERVFGYARHDDGTGTSRPRVDFHTMTGPFRVGEVDVRPVPVRHGAAETYGFVFSARGRTCGYAPDCSWMPDETAAALSGVDVMILDALRHRAHPTHLTVSQALTWLARIRPGRSYLTHLSHELEHSLTERLLPRDTYLSYDGLVLEW